MKFGFNSNMFNQNIFNQQNNQQKPFEYKPRKDHGPKGTIKALLFTLLAFVIFEYFALIPINLRSPGFYQTIAVFVFIFVMLHSFYRPYERKIKKAGILVAGGLFLLTIVLGFASAAIFHASSYQQQLGMDEYGDFEEDVSSISFNQIPIVDRESATRLGNRKMGEIMDYVSQFDVADNYTQINYKQKPYRVTPIYYSGFIKWLNNFREGLPAYITVDMVSQEAKIVRLEQKMKYSESDKFFRNIYRHLFVNYPTKLFDTLQFEIDEQGTPYFVAPVYEYTIGVFGGKDITGIVLCNAIDGNTEYYDINEAPTWLDRVYPEPLVMEQLENWGKYKRGFMNTLFGQREVLQPTDGYNYIAINDDVYLYTGLTSVTSDESNVGFALINLRTKESKFYNIPGAEEYSAMLSAQGQVQDLHYTATFPILINCGGEPTYFMALKDGGSLVKQYAFVNVKNYTVVATGTTVQEAQKKYYQVLANNGGNLSNIGNTVDYQGELVDIASVVVEGNSRFYFTISGSDKIFIAPISLSDQLPLLKQGDMIKVSYMDSADESVVVSSLEKVGE